jgi:medium-chain acyl-[acyl-carrier-protein] hydrolase
VNLPRGPDGGPLKVLTPSPWIRRYVTAAAPRLRLACLPHAGGGGSVFTSWVPLLHERVELVAVVLPGRETRVRETPRDDRPRLVADLWAALDFADGVPLALYGHSLGAALMFEVARTAHAADSPDVAHLIVSGFQAPHLPSALPPMSHLPRADLVAALSRLDGLPPEVLAHDDFLDLVLRAVRADLRLAEEYRCRPGPPLSCPITVLAGTHDPMTTPSTLDGWGEHTAAGCERITFEGNHFFILSRAASVVAAINRVLTPYLAA